MLRKKNNKVMKWNETANKLNANTQTEFQDEKVYEKNEPWKTKKKKIQRKISRNERKIMNRRKS